MNYKLDEMAEPLLVEESFTFDEREGLKNTEEFKQDAASKFDSYVYSFILISQNQLRQWKM